MKLTYKGWICKSEFKRVFYFDNEGFLTIDNDYAPTENLKILKKIIQEFAWNPKIEKPIKIKITIESIK
jgi:hypothetical protein